jgi:Ser/Thr protein kinase RdoA (MazF antagonist)
VGCRVQGRTWKEVDRKAFTDEPAAAYGEAAATVHSAADHFKAPPLRPTLDLVELLDRPLQLVTSTIVHRPEDVAYITAFGERLRGSLHAAMVFPDQSVVKCFMKKMVIYSDDIPDQGIMLPWTF